MSIATGLGDLLAKDEIRDAMARYARGIDRRDEALVRSAYHEDSWDNHGWGLEGPGWEIAAMVRPVGGRFPDWTATQHFLGQHLIDVHGDDATSEVYFQAIMRYAAEGLDWDFVSVGRYLDRWERRDGAFRIAARHVVYDYWRTDAVQTPWPGPDHDVPKMIHGGDRLNASAVMGTSGPDDPSYELLRLPTRASGADA
jgi:hypothetical protein